MNIVYNMDCMEGMKEYPDKYFDLAIVDPPYGAGLAEGGGCQGWFAKYREDNQDRENKELGAHFVGRGRSKKFKDAHLEYLNGGVNFHTGTDSAKGSTDTSNRSSNQAGGGCKIPRTGFHGKAYEKTPTGSEHQTEREMGLPQVERTRKQKNHFVGCGARAGLL